ncbi:MAG TPA: SDR family NAD(P)-dependent oxidoreductase [Feifaniaceae bacterium]|nr:SDR family NAD(P)-dependent oxidoreductase [Feifaniaceae bacterium]
MLDMGKWEQLAARCAKDRPGVPGRLGGKIAVVTGSAQGFGRGIAEELYREGACVVLADLNEALAAEVAKELGERAFAVKADVSSEEGVAHMIGATVERFHGLDLFVSNAGVLKAGSLDELEKKDFEFVTSINYTAFFLCAKYASRVMKAQFQANPDWSGDIIQINSKSGLVGSNKNFAYAGSKFGGIGLVESFALELCPFRIKVNAICPGNFLDGPLWMDPERGLFVQYLNAGKVPGAKTAADVKRHYESLVPMKRGCFPRDVARAIFYAVEQNYETGQAIPVTGGQNMLH